MTKTKPSDAAPVLETAFSNDLFMIKEISKEYMPEDVKKILLAFSECNEHILNEIIRAVVLYDFFPQAEEPYPYEEYIHHLAEAYYNILHEAYLIDGMITREDELSQYSYGKQMIDEVLCSFFRITVDKDKDWTKITLNKRLPMRKASKTELSRYAKRLRKAFSLQVKQDRHIKKAYMIFVHHYNAENSMTVRDVDNYEEKPLSDIISDFFIFGGDGPENVQRCSFAKEDNNDFTQVYLVPHENIIKWHQKHPFFT